MIELRVERGRAAAASLLSVKRLAWEHPGEHELNVVVGHPHGGPDLRLTLGEEWRYSGTPACLSALAEFGETTLR